MNNKKQNSVIFLIEKIAENQLQRDLTMFEWAKIFEEAIAMHKEEITDAYIDGHSTWGENTNAEKYYNEKF
jgi:hypothetical protein